MQIITASSLDKIFFDGGVNILEQSGVMLRNERFHFQVAVYNDNWERLCGASLKISGTLAKYVTVRTVDSVPALLTMYKDADDFVLCPSGRDSGLYPDILREENKADLPSQKWMSFWVTVFSKDGVLAGTHTLDLEIVSEGQVRGTAKYVLEVLPADIKETDFPVTNWMHYDAIANYYGIKPWSKPYYDILGTFIEHAVSHGVNMLYVPLFTPPLDTLVGGERLDVQLIRVKRIENKYTFDVSELEKFLNFALKHGIKYFEMCHLATQWGAAACPKIMATTETGYERIFGWDTSSTSDEYLNFLSACLSEVDALFKRKGISDACFFHISDEPSQENIDNYRKVYSCIHPIIENYKLIEASTGYGADLVDIPVFSTSHLQGALTQNAFVYYCCSSYKQNLANRFINMPSVRSRVLGLQLWLNKANGFLHWGFNFYNDGLSHRALNPFMETDAGGHFPAGDSFVVYPGRDGAWDSLRLEVFYDALQDRAVCQALEEKYGRVAVEKILSDAGVCGWDEYPHDAVMYKTITNKLRRLLVENITV